LPLDAGVDGRLGLDFFRGRILTLDFRGGLIALWTKMVSGHFFIQEI